MSFTEKPYARAALVASALLIGAALGAKIYAKRNAPNSAPRKRVPFERWAPGADASYPADLAPTERAIQNVGVATWG